jgi:hypothetical protein
MGDPCRERVFQDMGLEPDAVAAEQDDQNLFRWLTGPIASVGLVAAAVGVVLLVSAPSEETVDRAAHASAGRLELGIGPGRVALSGTF